MTEPVQLEFDFKADLGKNSKHKTLEDVVHEKFWAVSDALTKTDDTNAKLRLAELKVIVLGLLDQTLQR